MAFGSKVLFKNISAHTSMEPECTVLQRVSVTMLLPACAIYSSLIPGESTQHYNLQRYTFEHDRRTSIFKCFSSKQSLGNVRISLDDTWLWDHQIGHPSKKSRPIHGSKMISSLRQLPSFTCTSGDIYLLKHSKHLIHITIVFIDRRQCKIAIHANNIY